MTRKMTRNRKEPAEPMLITLFIALLNIVLFLGAALAMNNIIFFLIIYSMLGHSLIGSGNRKRPPPGLIATIGRPLGLIIITICMTNLGLNLLPESLFSIEPSDQPHNPVNDLYAYVLGGAVLTAAFGLFYLKEWGRKGTFWILLVDALFRIVTIFSFLPLLHMTEIVIQLVVEAIKIGVSLLIIFYLSRDWVKELFLPKAFG